MSCHSLKDDITTALIEQSKGNIQRAKMNVEIYLHSPVGIGEHPDVLGAIQDQIDLIAKEEERIQVISKHFTS
jgi:hypothetical protein|tara:strand:- start:634 stop:852 length:219 start_codon:yes stop_codon:yes gene_type:complete